MPWKKVFDGAPYLQRNAPDINRTQWGSPHYQPDNNPAFIGRTGIRNPNDFQGQIGLIPCTVENGANLRLSTYNPLAPNRLLKNAWL